MLNLASIDNLSGAPWRLLPPPVNARLHFATPNAIYQALRAGACDAGLLPVARLRELSHRYLPLGAYGIACTGAVRSVALLSKMPLADLFAGQEPIHITHKSETSRQLLRILARETFGTDPVEAFQRDAATATLLIGDDAIVARRDAANAYTTDLCDWWHNHTGLPFVFARWVVRRDLPRQERTALESWVNACADAAGTGLGCSALVSHNIGMLDQASRAQYYAALRFRLSNEDCQAITRFEQLQLEHATCRQTA